MSDAPLVTARMLARIALVASVGTAGLAKAQETVIDPKMPLSETVALPVPEGRIDAALGKLDDFAADIMKRSGIPGMAVVVVRDGKTVYLKGFGVRKAGEAVPVDADTVFQLASISKALGAGVVAHQVGKGVVAWDTPVAGLLPSFGLKDPWVGAHVTIGDLYAHRSGLPEHAGDDLEMFGFDRRQILERLKLLPLAPFRVTYAYTNFGVTAAAEAVAAASGKSWEELSQEVLYGPLGMSATSSRFSDYAARPNRAALHVRENGAFVARFQRQSDPQSPAGGASSSARDMGRWLAFLTGNGTVDGREIVPAAALLPAMTAQIISTPSASVSARPGFYGYGFGVAIGPSGRVQISHSGAFLLGASTNFVLLPSQKLGIAVLTNAPPLGAAEALSAQFMDQVLFGRPSRDWLDTYAELLKPLLSQDTLQGNRTAPPQPEPAQRLATYAGTYANAYFGPATVRVSGDRLVLGLGPKPMEATLRHWSGDTFTFEPTGEFLPGTSVQLTFTRDGQAATAMKMDLLDGDGFGTFTRQ